MFYSSSQIVDTWPKSNISGLNLKILGLLYGLVQQKDSTPYFILVLIPFLNGRMNDLLTATYVWHRASALSRRQRLLTDPSSRRRYVVVLTILLEILKLYDFVGIRIAAHFSVIGYIAKIASLIKISLV
ncbi:hypothetical protein SLE2022_318080 [Rubroshorea leprosula]